MVTSSAGKVDIIIGDNITKLKAPNNIQNL